nr:MAG TPA: hypothetical protein [Caudoviricetes sp.]
MYEERPTCSVLGASLPKANNLALPKFSSQLLHQNKPSVYV